jgi:hypothetical protein
LQQQAPGRPDRREDRGVKIDVRDNQIEAALKALKKLMVKTGLF